MQPATLTAPSAEDIARCVHCGLCLQACPTYLQTGQETESPRGRIHLIAALNEGRIEPTEAYQRHVALCLVCRGCETACPSGVPFGRIMEAARAQLAELEPPRGLPGLLRRLVFEQLLPRPGRLLAAARLLRLYQRSGLQRLVRASGLLGLVPGLERAELQLPTLPERFFRPRYEVYPAFGEPRHRVAFFSGCVMPYLYPRVHAATLRVLRRNGCEVLIPRQQVCCGALQVHSGDQHTARELARRNIAAFADLGVEAIVVNAAGCGSTLKDHDQLLGEHGAAGAAERLALSVKDVSEYLASIDLEPPTRAVRRRVTLQESCHLAHAQRVRAAPRALLAQIPGLELVDLAHPDLCCGSAGIYNLVQAEMSTAILRDRMAEVRDTSADTLVTMNPGCQLQLESGARQFGPSVEVKHLVELLDEAYD
jgi:Fe-S oxidoreductase